MDEKEQTKKRIMKRTGCPFQQEEVQCGQWCELFVKTEDETGECAFHRIAHAIDSLPQDFYKFFG